MAEEDVFPSVLISTSLNPSLSESEFSEATSPTSDISDKPEKNKRAFAGKINRDLTSQAMRDQVVMLMQGVEETSLDFDSINPISISTKKPSTESSSTLILDYSVDRGIHDIDEDMEYAPWMDQTTSGQTIVEPVLFEEYLSRSLENAQDYSDLDVLWAMPTNSLKLENVKREHRVVDYPVPLKLMERSDEYIKTCANMFMQDWSVISREYGDFNGFSEFAKTRNEKVLCKRTPSYKEKLYIFHYQVDFSHALTGNKSESEEDPVLNEAVEEINNIEFQDEANTLNRRKYRHDTIFSVYSSKPSRRGDVRGSTKAPQDYFGSRFKIHVTKFDLGQKFEPLFGSLFLYDTRAKKRISENLYFDFNEDEQHKLLSKHILERAYETKAHAGLFSVTNLHPDVFIVIKVEKVLQGETAKSSAEIYASDKGLKQNALDKLKGNATEYCERLGKYRMPFAWYCVSMAKIFETKLKDRDVEVIPPLDSFFHCTVKLQCLIVQESDRMKDEDLIRYCVELKKYEAGARARPKTNFEYVRADIAIEVSTIVEGDLMCVYSSTYNRIKGKEVKKKFRPIREIEEFPAKEIYKPYVSYKNLLYIYPQSLNLMKAGSTHWRNIAIRITYLTSEDHNSALNIIYGKSNSPKFLNEAWSNVTYHNRTPDFYDEIKIDLPANISEFSHLLFQFYHITCQKRTKKEEDAELMQFVGVTWLPIINIKTGRVIAGDISLPISSEGLPRDYSRADPEIALPSIKWMDNHRSLFKLNLHLISSFHPQCSIIHNYLTTAFWASKLEIEPTPSESICVIKDLKNANTENLVRFAHILLDSLFKYLVVEGPVSIESFNGLAQIVHLIHQTLLHDEESTGRNRTLATYIHYVFRSPDPLQSEPKGCGRYLHEVLIELWQKSRNDINNCVNSHAWFYFEIIVKSMIQTLYRTGSNNTKQIDRFSEEFYMNLLSLVENLIALIVHKVNSNNSSWAHHLSQSLAYFISDCFNVINRTYILKMVHVYFKRLCQANIECNAYIQLRIDFLHVICMHEYFVQMNLPIPEWWISQLEKQISDDLSLNVYSWDGEQQFSIPSFIELSSYFMEHHYLVGCLLSTVKYVLSQKQFPIKSKLVSLLRDLLESHDADFRYEKIKSYIAYLYLPLVGIAIDCIPILYTSSSDDATRHDIQSGPFNLNQLKSRASVLIHTPKDLDGKDTWGLEPQTTKDLLFCFLWVMKNVDYSLKHHLFRSMTQDKLEVFLHLLDICLNTFEYMGIESMRTSVQQIQPTDTIKQDLTSMILGQNSNVQRLRMLHDGKKGDQENEEKRWKLSTRTNTMTNPKEVKENDKLIRIDAQIGCNLSVEVSLIILDLIEALIREDIQDEDLNFNHSERFRVTSVIPSILQLFLHFLTTNQCTYVISCVCSSLRSLIYKYPEFILFHFQEQCSALCQNLLKHCSSNLAEIRMEATGTLYALMRRHFILAGTFAYVKVQITSALSSIVGEMVDKTESSHDVYLRCSLNTLTKYAKSYQSCDDNATDSTFPSQVESLSANLLHVIDDTAKLRACGADSEMRLDLMYSIAKSYQNSPDLRIAWLENMMTKNKEEGNNSEAGMCLIHIAAIISEYLGRIDPKPYMPIGAVSFQKISPNVIEESAVSEDTVSAKEEGVCNSSKFSEEGIQGMIKLAREAFSSAQLYEAVVEIDKVLIPILESKRAYTKLSRTHEQIHHCYRLMEGGIKDRKFFASYYRVAFFGEQFIDRGGEQFIYKCNTICKLSEFKFQMETVMRQKYQDVIRFIQEGGKVDKSTLLPGYVYVQVTYVEPYFDEWEKRDRQTEIERSFNVNRFFFLSPFTKDGRSHGNPQDQYARLTIFTTYNTFPYLKSRVSVMCEEEIELSPIEMGIEEIRKQTEVIGSILDSKPKDVVMLDMRLSGAIAPTVNQGPIAIARAFLRPNSKSELTNNERWLRVQFRDFLRISERGLIALKENSSEVGMKKEYLRNLEKNLHNLKEELKPLLESGNRKSGRNKKKKNKEGQIFNRISGVSTNLRINNPNGPTS